MSRMLLGETQKDLATALKDFFSLDHYTVQVADSGLLILECLRQNQYDIVILEMALPGLDGINVVRSYRATGGNTPIVLIASRHSSTELQCGLDAGADAYFVKPFRLLDLAAQLRALLRRPALRCERVLRLAGIEMDSGAGTVTKNDIQIHLRPMEFQLLQFLMRHPDQVFSAQALFERVWQKDFGLTDDTVRTHVRTLRLKIHLEGCASIITTVRGRGYKASVPKEAHQSRDPTSISNRDQSLDVDKLLVG